MRLVAKIALLFLPLFALSAVLVLWLSSAAIESGLLAQVEREGASRLETLAPQAARPLSRREELGLLPGLQAAVEQTGALYAAALSTSGLVVAHTDVAQVGRVPHDAAAAAGPLPSSRRAEYRGRMVLDVSAPVWLEPSGPEALLFAEARAAAKTRVGTLRLGMPLEEAFLTRVRIARQMTAILLACFAACLGGALLLVRGVLMPVRQLTDAVSDVARGVYDVRVPVRSNDELGRLAEGFNRMSEVLARTTISKEFLDAVLGSMVEPLAVLRSDGTIRTLNRAATELLGCGESECIGRHVREIFPEAHRPMVEEALRAALEGRPPLDRESELRTTRGSHVPVLVSWTALKDKEGRRIGLILAARDITERKRSEAALARQAERLERSNADLQQFAYAASHDLQEPLRKVAGFADLLARRHKDKLDGDAERYLKFIVDGVVRMQTLINDLLAYSRVGREQEELKRVRLDPVVDGVLQDLERTIADTRAVIGREELPAVLGRPTELRQLFQNLISNGLKFHGDKPPRISIGAKLDHGRWLCWVKDEGIGIPKDLQPQLFALFRRLHPRAAYPGTGIGLALCKKIVESSGGRIWIESEEGKGTTFYFTLPEVV